MNCAACGGPIHWSEDGNAYYHDYLTDILTCTAGTIERASQPVPAPREHVGRHITDTELARRITANYTERTATHRAMIVDNRPVVDPLSDEWASLSERYQALAGQSDDLYAELNRREMAGVLARVPGA